MASEISIKTMTISSMIISQLFLVATQLFFGPYNNFALGLSLSNTPKKVLVLGKGFVGNQVLQELDKLGVPSISLSKSGKGGVDFEVDLTAEDAEDTIESICRNNNVDAIISTVGSIGQKDDYEINAASAKAAIGAKRSECVKRFVFIGNDDAVRDFAKDSPFLKNYAKGKAESETTIKAQFPGAYTIVEPNFIYGGDDFSLTPPRVPQKLGSIAEDILGLYPIQAISEKLPGMLGVAAGAPVSVENVAKAAINAALGVISESELESRNDIILAASKRPQRLLKDKTTTEKSTTSTEDLSEEEIAEKVRSLKIDLYAVGDCAGDDPKLQKAFGILEEIEDLLVRVPTTDPILNGRWDFDFDVEADAGSAAVKDILQGRSPIKGIFNVQDICLNIFEDQGEQKVNVYVSTKLLSGITVDLIVKTIITPDPTDTGGTMFLERFEGIKLAGIPLPIPDDWKKGRPCEFSYLDETMLIARGNGGNPHYLRREALECDVDLENCYL